MNYETSMRSQHSLGNNYYCEGIVINYSLAKSYGEKANKIKIWNHKNFSTGN